jgi:hypothetical protein
MHNRSRRLYWVISRDVSGLDRLAVLDIRPLFLRLQV